jgi:hypothetical protein
MEFEFVKYDKRDHIGYITFNRPERLNALHPACHVEMTKVWDDFIADKAMWVAIVTGAGDKAFSAGNDLRYTAEHRGEPVSEVLKQAKGGFAGITSRYDIYKPIIAAVNGFALGGGFEIALACDIIIAADHARFGLPEPRVGLMAGAGGVHRLPRQIPAQNRHGHDADRQAHHRAGSREVGYSERGRAAEGSHPDRGAMGEGNHGMLTHLDPGLQAGRDGRSGTLDGRRERQALPTEREAMAFEGRHRRTAGILAKAQTELDRGMNAIG